MPGGVFASAEAVEDRRLASSADPYAVINKILRVVCFSEGLQQLVRFGPDEVNVQVTSNDAVPPADDEIPLDDSQMPPPFQAPPNTPAFGRPPAVSTPSRMSASSSQPLQQVWSLVERGVQMTSVSPPTLRPGYAVTKQSSFEQRSETSSSESRRTTVAAAARNEASVDDQFKVPQIAHTTTTGSSFAQPPLVPSRPPLPASQGQVSTARCIMFRWRIRLLRQCRSISSSQRSPCYHPRNRQCLRSSMARLAPLHLCHRLALATTTTVSSSRFVSLPSRGFQNVAPPVTPQMLPPPPPRFDLPTTGATVSCPPSPSFSTSSTMRSSFAPPPTFPPGYSAPQANPFGPRPGTPGSAYRPVYHM